MACVRLKLFLYNCVLLIELTGIVLKLTSGNIQSTYSSAICPDGGCAKYKHLITTKIKD